MSTAKKKFEYIRVTIEGTRPLMQAHFGVHAEESVQQGTRSTSREQLTPREQAERLAYRAEDGTLWHPGDAISRAVREVASYHKLAGSRKSAKVVSAAAFLVLTECIPLHQPGDPTKRFTTYEIDSRRVVNQVRQTAQIAHRPRFDRWAATFDARVNVDIFSTEFVHELIIEAGEKVGIGVMRPERGGSFGMFRVTAFTLTDDVLAGRPGDPIPHAAE